MRLLRSAATLLLILGACATKPAAPRWSARVEQRSETEFVLLVVGDATVRGQEVPVLMASLQQPWDPRILHLDLRFMPLLDRRLLDQVRGSTVNFTRPVASPTSVTEVVVFSMEHPTVRVPVSSKE
ncbi:MAG: hypothetical protein ACKVXR_05390 [Planctomycetota bacterium]